MFGTFRVLLAVLVVIYHILQTDFNIAVVAVVNFFIISGYVMTHLIRTHYADLGRAKWRFYLDRFLRIYPQFLFFLILAQVIYYFFNFQANYLIENDSPILFFTNALLVPLNYFFVFPKLASYQLIFPAWSLALEEQLYWLLPFLVLRPAWARITALTSFMIFMLASLGILNNQVFSYYFLPGVVFIFLLGKNLADYISSGSNEAYWTVLLLYLATAQLALFGLLIPGLFQWPETKSILTGIIVGVPVVYYLSRLARKKWDDFLGQCSFGVFLSHILIRDLLDILGLHAFFGEYFILAVVGLSIVAGFIGYFVAERLFLPLRLSMRKKTITDT